MDRNYDAITFFLNIVILGRPGVANFAEIIKIEVTLIRKLVKINEGKKGITSYVL